MLELDRLNTGQMVLDNLKQVGIDANGNVPRLNKGYESTASTLVIVECQLEDLA